MKINTKIKQSALSIATLLFASSTLAGVSTIEPGKDWLDTNDQLIEAHGGDMMLKDGVYYWIGQDRTKNSNTFKAINCYKSTDLSNWEFVNTVMSAEKNPDLPTEVIIARPKFVYNNLTDSYVMWFKYRNPKGVAPNMRAGIASSKSVCGDYKEEGIFFPTANHVSHYAGDNELVVDENGNGYYVLSSIGELKHGEMGQLTAGKKKRHIKIFKLTPDFRDLEKLVYEFPVETNRKENREGPGVFKMGDKYVMFSSGTMGWKPNQQRYSMAPSMEGPWSEWKDIGDNTAFDSQTAFIIPVPGEKGTSFIYGGDRHTAKNLAESRYIWLPIKETKNGLTMDWQDKWTVNVKSGELSTD
ncbi:family 43 glycosylhydrolase [Photobacterium sagamiensis]|uniref:family 43 glycosylhydrolase n=1 Tax=Photobacterium sagamiensis TaxID=2910241 RepID=UPI003D1152BD